MIGTMSECNDIESINTWPESECENCDASPIIVVSEFNGNKTFQLRYSCVISGSKPYVMELTNES